MKNLFFSILFILSIMPKLSAAPARCSQWKEVSELLLSYKNRNSQWSFDELKSFEDKLTHHLQVAGYSDIEAIIAKVIKKHKDINPNRVKSAVKNETSPSNLSVDLHSSVQSLTKTRTVTSSSGEIYKYKLSEGVTKKLLERNSPLLKELEEKIFAKKSVVRAQGETGIKQLDADFFEIKFSNGHRIYGCKIDGVIHFTKWVKNKKLSANSNRGTVCAF